ncbi:MAG TPA: insulinase family protein [Chitinophagales bacterium]|nr:insulinase family protein [Chitinophagales bacterium]
MTYLLKPLNTVMFLCLLLTIKAQSTQTDKTLDNSVHLSKNLNGLNVLTIAQPDYSKVEITLYVKTGPVYENDSVSGISNIVQSIIADKIANHLRKNLTGLSFQNTQFSSYITTESSLFQLTCPAANYAASLQLLRDSVFVTTISQNELDKKLEEVRKEIETGKSDYKTIYEIKLLSRLFRKDATRQILTGDTSGKFPYIDLGHVRSYWARYYVPNNSILNAYGNFSTYQFQDKVAMLFKDVLKSKFDKDVISKIIDFKGMIYSTQFVVNAPVEEPQIEICWLFPGTRSNVKSSYYAYLLSAMLNDPNNHIQVKARKMGCKKFTAVYDARNFSGIFRIMLQPDKTRLFETYHFVLNEVMRLDETLLNESMMGVGMLNFKKEYNNIKASKEYLQWLSKYYVYDDETYFQTLDDSVGLLGERRMRKFVIEYIKQSPHVTGLLVNETDRTELKVDSILPELDASIHDYVFKYRPNISDLEGAENQIKLSNLLNWLQANPDLTVQVNGCSDRSEYGRAKDDTIKAFIDSIPTFKKVKEDWVKTGAIRIEMMRAMKIIKYLYDKGVAIDRIKGTSMPFTSKNESEELENMKCTITIDKIRKAPSVYEYHYGKKKEENEQR